MTTFTHPIYQSGPLAAALTAFQTQQDQAAINYEETQRQIKAQEAAQKEKLISVARERFGALWAAMSPYITGSWLSWEREIVIQFELPEVPRFYLTQQLEGYASIEFPGTSLDRATFDKRYPINEYEVGGVLAEAHTLWQKRHQEQQAAKEVRERKLHYLKAFLDYEQEHINTIARNSMGLQILQDEYQTSFPVWRLTYGITAYNDDEGEFYADTRGVWVLHPDPDEDGFFSVIEDTGKVSHRKYYSLVYIEGPQDFNVEFGSTHCGHLHVKEADGFLYFSPLLKYAEVLIRVRSFVEANMFPLPDPPLYTAFGLSDPLERWEIEKLKAELCDEVNEEEIPF